MRLLFLSFVLCAAAARAEPDCPPAGALDLPLLPHTRTALATNQPLLFVALGSSSTRGWMASNVGHSYPAILQRRLNETLPQTHVAIVNRGIGGQDAPEELGRMDADVVALRPVLVIWQVGANGAIHGLPADIFGKLVSQGVEKLKAANADVILMDNQRSPRILAAPEHTVLDATLREVAAREGVNLFSRGTLMDHWRDAGADYDDFTAPDGLHMNDRGYACLADALAERIGTALRQPITEQVKR